MGDQKHTAQRQKIKANIVMRKDDEITNKFKIEDAWKSLI